MFAFIRSSVLAIHGVRMEWNGYRMESLWIRGHACIVNNIIYNNIKIQVKKFFSKKDKEKCSSQFIFSDSEARREKLSDFPKLNIYSCA